MAPQPSHVLLAAGLVALAGCAVGTSPDDGSARFAATEAEPAGAPDVASPLPSSSPSPSPTAAPRAPSPETAPADDAGAPVTEVDGNAPLPSQGEVVISEVMFNPSGAEPEGEWFELHNTTTEPRALGGLVLKDGASPAGTHTLPPIVVAPKAFVVIAAAKSAVVAAGVPAATVVHAYGTALTLGNTANGALVLSRGTTEIARARYGALGLGTVANGQSVQLSVLTWPGSGVAASWCKSAASLPGATDKGTPGAGPDCS